MATRSKYMFFLFLFLSGICSVQFAQQMSVELKDLSKGADIILTGKVTQQSSSWNDNNTRIYTEATIQVNEYLKGNSRESSVVVRYLGGEVGDVGELYSHMPRFEDNEEVLVFLTKDTQNSIYKVFNGEEGKINIIEDQQTGEKLTTSNVKLSSLKVQIANYINEQ